MTARTTVRELVARWQQHGDRAARDQLVARMLPLVQSLARRYAGKGEPLDDLEQVACVGLLKAIDRFDLDRDVKFTTFAVPTIAGELKRHFRDRAWMVRVPRELQELAGRLSDVREHLTVDLGRAPTVSELSVAAGAGPEAVLEAIGASSAYRTMSLDEPLTEGGHGAVATLGDHDAGFELAEHRTLLRGGLAALDRRDRLILHLRFYEGLSQREIAKEVGISQMHVSRLIRRAIEELRRTLVVPLAA